MKKHQWLSLIFTMCAAGGVMAADANDAAVNKAESQKHKADAKKNASTKPEELTKTQQADEAKREAEAAAREKPLIDADALMKAGKPADAYNLLEPLEFDRSGEVRFDYLLGIAALDSGKADKATLAFERVLAVDPNFAGARLDMARAYYQLGDLPRAKTEFETVLKQNPPEAARLAVQKYLDAIAAYEQGKKTQIAGYIEGTAGHDGNVNTGTGSSISVASLNAGLASLITAFTGIQNPQIPPSKRSSDYYGVAEGVNISHSLDANWSIYGGADLRLHNNTTRDLDVYNTSNIGERVGVMYANEQNAYKLTLTNGQLYSGKTMRTDLLGMNAEWQHTFNQNNLMSAFAQYGQNRAFGRQPTDTANPPTDVRIEGNIDQVIAGAGWVHILADGKKILFGNLVLGNELDVAPPTATLPAGGRVDGKKRFSGLSIGGQMPLAERIDGFSNLSWQHARYTGANAFIANNGSRREDQYDLVLGANWHFDKLWTAKPQIAFTKKNSNLALFSFDRKDVSLTIRHDF